VIYAMIAGAAKWSARALV